MAGDVDGKHKGATGHVLAADFGGGAYKIQLDVNNKSVTVPSANLGALILNSYSSSFHSLPYHSCTATPE